MSNVNFIVKASRPIQDCSTRTQLRSCVSIDVEHDQCDGITLWLNGVDGSPGIPEVFKIPDFNWQPKSIDQWEKENLFKSLIIENMAGNTVHQYRFKGKDIDNTSEINNAEKQKPYFYISRSGAIILNYTLVIVFVDHALVYEFDRNTGYWYKEISIPLSDIKQYKTWLGSIPVEFEMSKLDVFKIAKKEVEKDLGIGNSVMVENNNKLIEQVDICILKAMEIDDAVLSKTIILRLLQEGKTYYFADRAGSKHTHDFYELNEMGWLSIYPSIVDVLTFPLKHSDKYSLNWVGISDILNDTINGDVRDRNTLLPIFDLAFLYFKKIDGVKSPSLIDGPVMEVDYCILGDIQIDGDTTSSTMYLRVAKDGVTYFFNNRGDNNENHSFWLIEESTWGDKFYNMINILNVAYFEDNVICKKQWTSLTTLYNLEYKPFNHGDRNNLRYIFDLATKHHLVFDKNIDLLSECIDRSSLRAFNKINF